MQAVAEVDQITSRFSPNAIQVFESRYLRKEEGRVVETVPELFTRVAKTVASVESKYGASETEVQRLRDRFFQLMVDQQFMPNSPTLMNAGRQLSMLSACFVLPIPDNIEGIMKAHVDTALVQRAGGGTGFTLDELRPCGSFIRSSGGRTSGPISFWRSLCEVTHSIQQGAFRRGANMMMMSIWHADIIKFICAKEDLRQFANYNISVKLTDEWMQTLASAPDTPHVVVNPHTETEYWIPLRIVKLVRDVIATGLQEGGDHRRLDNCYAVQDLVPVGSATDQKLLTHRGLWDLLIENAWRTGEPGVVFIDRVRATEPTPHIGRIEASNPCGEQFLLPNEACNLGSLNLCAFFKPVDLNGDVFYSLDRDYDWEALKQATRDGVRFLDNVIDANKYPTPEITKLSLANRKIGLGIMGLADMLYRIGVPYDSPEALEIVGSLLKFVNEETIAASSALAEERGVFPNWEGSRWQEQGIRMRNADISTIAPTGTISLVAGCSCGLEPIFSLAFKRHVLDGKQLNESHPFFEEVARKAGFWDETLLDEAERHGSIQHLEQIPKKYRRVFVCAHDVSVDAHVRMQATCQQHVSNSISKTINLPHDASLADVESVYRSAFKLGCKAVTVYRNGCRENQPMALKGDGKSMPRLNGELVPMNTPEICASVRLRQATAFGHLHVNVVVDPETEKELEVFAQLGHAGSMEQADLEAICRMISLLLRSGFPLTKIIAQLTGIGTSVRAVNQGEITSLPKGLAETLIRYYKQKQKSGLRAMLTETTGGSGTGVGTGCGTVCDNVIDTVPRDVPGYALTCPFKLTDCAGYFVREGACATCRRCGVSTC